LGNGADPRDAVASARTSSSGVYGSGYPLAGAADWTFVWANSLTHATFIR
jgi:hypothetical protein